MHDPDQILAINKVLQEYMRTQGLHALPADEAAALILGAGVLAPDKESSRAPGLAFRELIKDLRKEYGYETLYNLLGAKQAHNRPGGHYTLLRFEPPKRETIIELLATRPATSDHEGDTLPDYLREGLDVVFVWFPAGDAQGGDHHYSADPHDRFWDLVNEAELVSDFVGAENDHLILDENCGLTSLMRIEASASDVSGEQQGFDSVEFIGKMEKYKPKIVAFNGRRAYKEVFKKNPGDYGLADDILGDSYVFVLPLSGGSDTSLTHQQKLHWYKKLKATLKTL